MNAAKPVGLSTRVIEEALRAVGEKPRPYSGRGMYGAHCPSFEANSLQEAFEVFAKLGQNDGRMGVEMAEDAVTDNMGHGIVVYWPSVTYPKSEVPVVCDGCGAEKDDMDDVCPCGHED